MHRQNVSTCKNLIWGVNFNDIAHDFVKTNRGWNECVNVLYLRAIDVNLFFRVQCLYDVQERINTE